MRHPGSKTSKLSAKEGGLAAAAEGGGWWVREWCGKGDGAPPPTCAGIVRSEPPWFSKPLAAWSSSIVPTPTERKR